MKLMRKKWRVLMLAVFIAAPVFLYSQEGPPNPPDDVEDVPFDGGISLLIAAGVGYGLKKAYDKKAADKEKESF